MNKFTIAGGITTTLTTLLVMQATHNDYLLTAALISGIGGYLLYLLGATDGSNRTIAYLQQEFDLIQADIDAELEAAAADHIDTNITSIN